MFTVVKQTFGENTVIHVHCMQRFVLGNSKLHLCDTLPWVIEFYTEGVQILCEYILI